MKITHKLFLSFIALLIMPVAAMASNSWQVTINSSRLPNYLDFPGCSLKAIVKLNVTYKENNNNSVSQQYETLYYNNGIPIGLKKHNPLALVPSAVGVICINSATETEMAADECDAVANGAGRMFLDLYSNQCAVYHVIVPQSSFDAMVAGFSRNGFHKQVPSDNPTAVLNVISSPSGKFQPMAF